MGGNHKEDQEQKDDINKWRDAESYSFFSRLLETHALVTLKDATLVLLAIVLHYLDDFKRILFHLEDKGFCLIP